LRSARLNEQVIAAFEPIWILTAVGYLAHRFGLLGENATAVLSRFLTLTSRAVLASTAFSLGTLAAIAPLGR
jgi:hypothetical protein